MRKLSLFLLLAIIVALPFCTSTKKAQSTAKPTATYTSNIQPLVINNCSPCHMPPKGNKKPLDTYASVKSNIDDIIERIQKNPTDKGFMPFKHPKLSDSTIQAFVDWKAQGMAE